MKQQIMSVNSFISIFSLNFRIGRGRRFKKLDIEPYHTLLKYHDDDEIRGSLLAADYSATVNRAIKVSVNYSQFFEFYLKLLFFNI